MRDQEATGEELQERSHRKALRGVVLAGGSAVMCVAAAPPVDAWPLAFLCWTPLLLAIDGLGWRRAALLGWLQGLLFNLAMQTFVVAGLQREAGLSLPTAVALLLGLSAWQGARHALLTACVAMAREHGVGPIVSFPIFLVAVELLYPMLFPWYSALFLHSKPLWLQLAAVGGPLLVSFWLAIVNGAVARALTAGGIAARAAALATGALTAALVAAFGADRIAAVEERIGRAPELQIGVIQGNVDKNTPGDAVVFYRDTSLSMLRDRPDLDLLLWPETAVAYPTQADRVQRFFRDHVLRDRRDGVDADRVTVPLLAGLVLSQRDPRRGTVLTNSAVLSDGGGRIRGIYDKQALLPIGERGLLGSWSLSDSLLPSVTSFSVVRAPEALTLGGLRLSVSICYEDILPGSFREAVRRDRPDLLVNLTSDNWFRGTSAASLHFALAKLRAVEHRRFLVRATNDGQTGVVSPTGDVVWALEAGTRAEGVTSVRLMDGDTLYGRLGSAPCLAAVFAGVILLVAKRPSPA